MHKPCEDQLDQAKKLGLFLRSSHYILTTGAIGINMKHSAQNVPTEFPYRFCIKKNMIFTEHHDAPVIPPKNMMVIDATVNRTTRSGDVLGEIKKSVLILH
jgi:predicted amidohydrolase YtcJ